MSCCGAAEKLDFRMGWIDWLELDRLAGNWIGCSGWQELDKLSRLVWEMDRLSNRPGWLEQVSLAG